MATSLPKLPAAEGTDGTSVCSTVQTPPLRRATKASSWEMLAPITATAATEVARAR